PAAAPTIVNTMTPIMKWNYTDDDGDEQTRYRVRILDSATGSIVVQSGVKSSSQKQWTVPAGTLVENHTYAAEVDVFDGFDWSNTSPRKYFMVNLLTVKGGVKHTTEWNANRQSYNLKISGDTEQPRGYNIFWAGEKFMLQADATGLPDTIEVTMDGGFTAQLAPSDSGKISWTGELYDPSFEQLPNGPLTFTFTAKNEYNTKTDKVTVTISENWSQYFRSHRVK
uniref:glycoside hydrolase family 78 protein n=1 Tax=Paenibacillus forsythiae TaxID=365616 RepID=UPI00046F277D